LRTTSSHPSHPPSLHDALPIFTTTVETDQPLCNFQLLPSITTHAAKHSPLTELTARVLHRTAGRCYSTTRHASSHHLGSGVAIRSEEHTSELQSRFDLVCRLLL